MDKSGTPKSNFRPQVTCYRPLFSLVGSGFSDFDPDTITGDTVHFHVESTPTDDRTLIRTRSKPLPVQSMWTGVGGVLASALDFKRCFTCAIYMCIFPLRHDRELRNRSTTDFAYIHRIDSIQGDKWPMDVRRRRASSNASGCAGSPITSPH